MQAIRMPPYQILTVLKHTAQCEKEILIYEDELQVITKQLMIHVVHALHSFSYVKMLNNKCFKRHNSHLC